MAQHDDAERRRVERELAKYAALDEADINDALRDLLANHKGRKLIWWLMQVGKYGTNPFSTDPLAMAFQAGEMNVGNAILQRLLDVNPLGFAELQISRKAEDERRNTAAVSRARDGDLFGYAGDDEPGT